MEALRETLGDILEPIKKILKKKPVMLEEQIRDEVPQELEKEEKENAEI
jgi:hypothetical protein